MSKSNAVTKVEEFDLDAVDETELTTKTEKNLNVLKLVVRKK